LSAGNAGTNQGNNMNQLTETLRSTGSIKLNVPVRADLTVEQHYLAVGELLGIIGQPYSIVGVRHGSTFTVTVTKN